MSRTRDWLKFTGLVVLTLVIGAVFVSALGRPTRAAVAEQASQASSRGAIPSQQPPPIPAAAAPLADLSNAFAAVAELIRPTVVFVKAETYTRENPHQGVPVPRGFEDFFFPRGGPRVQQGRGSGFVITPDGYILTNNHVVEGANKVTVRLLDKREFDAKVVGRDPQTDVAVIKIDADNLHAATLGNSDSVRIGEWVLAVGNPLGEAFTFTVTGGIVSAKGRGLNGLNRSSYSIMDFIQTDAVINPGNSGGPLVNLWGQVVGVNSAIASENGFYQGYGFAIPVNLARTVANQLIADGRVRRSVLGVSIDDADENDAAYAGLSEVRGVLVRDYSIENSPAKAAGILPEDLIIELDGEPVYYVAQLQQMVGFRKPGSTVRVTVVRKGGERHTYTVRLVEAPTDEVTQVARAEETPEPEESSGGSAEALGISVQQLPTEVARRLGPEHTGVLVTDVEISSPARDRLNTQRSGAPDVITHVNGTRVRTAAEFERAMGGVRPGDVISLRIYNPQGGGLSRVERIRAPR
jgi:serine protease Do